MVIDEFDGKLRNNSSTNAEKWRRAIEVFGNDSAIVPRKFHKKRDLKESHEVKPEYEGPNKRHRMNKIPDNTRREEWALVLAVSEEGDQELDTTSLQHINSDNCVRDLKLRIGQVGRALFDGVNVYFICVKKCNYGRAQNELLLPACDKDGKGRHAQKKTMPNCIS